MDLKPIFTLRVNPKQFKKLSRFRLFFDETDLVNKHFYLESDLAQGCLLLSHSSQLMGRVISHSQIKLIDENLYMEFNLLDEIDSIGVKGYLHLAKLSSMEIIEAALELSEESELGNLEFTIVDQCSQLDFPYTQFGTRTMGELAL